MVDPKDPTAEVDYLFDWTLWLGADSIASHTVTATGVDVDSSTSDGHKVTAWLAGGTADTWAEVTCHITTVNGRIEDHTMSIWVTER